MTGLDAPGANDGLTLRGVGCARGGRLLFEGLSLSLQPGQVLQIRGANGSGKSSLLRTLCGLQPPASGDIQWRGQPIRAQREAFCQSMAYLGHGLALSDDLSASANLASAMACAAESTSPQQISAALADAGLTGHEHRPLKCLSQGQRRRCALARLSLSTRRPLWVLDEPFAALDAHAIGWLQGVLQAHLQRAGMLVLTSHQAVGLDTAPHWVVDL